MLMNFRLSEIHTYVQKAFHYNYSHSHSFCSSPRTSLSLCSLFHVIFFLFFFLLSSLHTNLSPPPHLATFPLHHIHVSFTHPLVLLSRRDGQHKPCSKCLAATKAGNEISSEDKKAIELMSCYNLLNAGKMEAKFVLSS